MSRTKKGTKIVGIFSTINALAMYIGVIVFWSYKDKEYAGFGSWMMIISCLLTGLSFTYVSASMFWPERFKKFWEWWDQGL